jgi:hypothetical protein
MPLVLTSLLILKMVGSFFASRLKQAEFLSNKIGSDNQSRQKDEKEHGIKYQKRKKVLGG